MVFLKSKVGEIATPFSEGTLKRKAHVVQVTQTPHHVAPFTDIAVVGDSAAVLREIRHRLAVEPAAVRRRETAIAEAKTATRQIAGELPSSPMTANYFFTQLGKVVGSLIEDSGFTYTGVYEVGRCGISAVRNVPRTGPGFSGWYGRATMGDAYQAIPAIAMSRDRNVIGFIGDGAAMLGPDVLSGLVEHVTHRGRGPGGNVTLFFLWNGGHSLIMTYQEGRLGLRGGRQMELMNLLPAAGDYRLGPLQIRRRRMAGFDEGAIRAALASTGEVNVFDVLLAHSNAGDGISLLDSASWQYGDLSPLSLRMAQQRREQR
jgi:thiamine pyrophosphate-dependent acetolactate synthase large subunit-like protein